MAEAISESIYRRKNKEKSPLQNDLKKFSRLRERWDGYDPIAILKLPFEDRLQYAKSSLSDANFCLNLTLENPGLIETARSNRPSKYVELRSWETELRLNALFMAPELINDEQVDSAVEAGILLSRELNTIGRGLEDTPELIKLHDVMALEAFWKFREAKTESGKNIAHDMLGTVILDSVQDIVGLTKILQRSFGRIDPGATNYHKGKIAEYMMVTWERLNLLLSPDTEAIGSNFIRSALNREDARACDKTKSLDSVIMRFNSKHEDIKKDNVKYLQYKLGVYERNYDPSITVQHVTGLRQALDVHDEDVIIDIAKTFDRLITNRSPVSRRTAIDHLRSYFEEPQIKRIST